MDRQAKFTTKLTTSDATIKHILYGWLHRLGASFLQDGNNTYRGIEDIQELLKALHLPEGDAGVFIGGENLQRF